MIRVKIEKKDNQFLSITLMGHAMYDDFGKDIVCSAVSSIVTTTVNGILLLDDKSISYEVKDEGLSINVLKEDRTTQVLLQNMIQLLSQLVHDYPENIQMK